MRNNENDLNGLDIITKQLQPAETGVRYQDDEEIVIIENEKSMLKTALAIAAGSTALTLAAVGGIYLEYNKGYLSAFKPEVHSSASIDEGGKALVTDINMDIQPITLSTAETKVTNVVDSFQLNFSVPVIKNFNIAYGKSEAITEAAVETEITLDPKDVTVVYDAQKKQLTYELPNATLATKVDIPTAGSTTTPKSAGITTLPPAALTKLSEAIASFDGDVKSTDVPFLGDIAKGNYSVADRLTKFAQLDVVVQADKQCTPLISKIPDFQEQLETNVKEVMNKEVSGIDGAAKYPGLDKLPDSRKEMNKLTENAIVEMPKDFTIAPDQKNIDKLNKYVKTKFFSTNINGAPSVKCGISKDVTLTRNDAKGDAE